MIRLNVMKGLKHLLGKIYNIYLRLFYRYDLRNKRGFWRIKRELTKIMLRGRIEELEPEPIYEMEWDNLVILDAARGDLYDEVNGETEKRISVGSHSSEFIEKTFSEGDFSDTVYVTANPFFSESKFEEITGRKVSQVFHEVFHTYMTDWNQEEGTVLPESLVRDAKTARKLFPGKKLVVHFMQPHYPFVKSDMTSKGLGPNFEDSGLSVWQRAEIGEYEDEELWTEYRKNLEYVMPHVDELVEHLEGRTVVTADHGNLAGEAGTYGHPRGISVKTLREVPKDVRKSEDE